MMQNLIAHVGTPGSMNNEKRALAAIVAILERSPLTPEAQAAVALNAATAVLASMPGVKERRGKVIKAMTEEFKSRLQKYLPQES